MSCVQPMVSVVIPVHAVSQEMLERAVSSIALQDYAHLEIVLVDDNDDAGDATCQTVVNKYAQAKMIRTGGLGASVARNAGLEAAGGDYVMFCDADDEYMLGAIAQAVELAEATHLDAVFGTVCNVYGSGRYWIRVSQEIGHDELVVLKGDELDLLRAHLASRTDLRFHKELNFVPVGPYAKIFRRECLKGLTFNTRLSVGEDAQFCAEFCRRASRVGIVNSVWYLYYQYETSLMHRDLLGEALLDQLRITKSSAMDAVGLTAFNAYASGMLSIYTREAIRKQHHRSLPSYLHTIRDSIVRDALVELDEEQFAVSRKMKMRNWLLLHNMPVLAWAIQVGIETLTPRREKDVISVK